MKKLLLFTLLLTTGFAYTQNFNYMGTFDSQGVPDYLDGRDEISAEFLERVNNSVPESFPVPIYNPHYITAGYDTDIHIEEDADVWVTFVKEGAGYKNVLGFYTYDIDNPRTTKPEDHEITIIFPNVSELYSGGGLIAGDRVKLGSFEAGTGIGWVLLANAWNGSGAGYGYWQLFSNPDFNPEAEETLRYHNVLLADPDEERIILGFEDIRRDYASCDQDFNDALFYVTASPYTAIKKANFAEVSKEAPVYSAFDGGLESNGDLSMLIAKRNMQRVKDGVYVNQRKYQKKYRRNSGQYKSAVAKDYFPDTGLFGDETTYISSPEDLLAITNATDVFAIDYYKGENRVAAALLTETSGKVYNHTKTICDRLNGSLLEDIRTIKLDNYSMIMAQIIRDTGNREYAISFSIKDNAGSSELMSFWNISQYPEGNYKNFQVWGSNMGQVSHIVYNILKTIKENGSVKQNNVEDMIPDVFVQHGYYDAGKIYLQLKNRGEATQVSANVNFKKHENAENQQYTKNVSLVKNEITEVALETGYLFDAGIGLYNVNAAIADELYLADGPWGIDYNGEEAVVNDFSIVPEDNLTIEDNYYAVERSITLDASIRGTVNIFRHIYAGELSFDASNYAAVEFTASNSIPVEVIIVQEGLSDWNNRLRYTIPASTKENKFVIPFDSFENGNGETGKVTKVKSVVFSLQGDYVNDKEVRATIDDLAFSNNTASLSIDNTIAHNAVTVSNYPNPFTMETTFTIPVQTDKVNLKVYDLNGRIMYQAFHPTANDNKTIQFNRNGLSSGFYVCQLTTADGETFKKKVLVN